MRDLPKTTVLLQNHANWWTIVGGVITGLSIVAAGGYGYAKIEERYGALPARITALEQSVGDLSRQVDALKSVQSKASLDWTGEWSGKWNDTWVVEFTIFYIYPDKYLVAYKHQEQQAGPVQFDGIVVATVEGNTLTWGRNRIIRKTSANTAEALGVFVEGKAVTASLRKADLE